MHKGHTASFVWRHNLLASLVLRPSRCPVTSYSVKKWKGKIIDYPNDYLDRQRSNALLVIPLDSKSWIGLGIGREAIQKLKCCTLIKHIDIQ